MVCATCGHVYSPEGDCPRCEQMQAKMGPEMWQYIQDVIETKVDKVMDGHVTRYDHELSNTY